MNYEIRKSPAFFQKLLTFNDLTRGDIFRCDEFLYFRTDLRDDVPYNAISLDDGEYEHFDDDVLVELYTGKLTFFEEYFKNKQED